MSSNYPARTHSKVRWIDLQESKHPIDAHELHASTKHAAYLRPRSPEGLRSYYASTRVAFEGPANDQPVPAHPAPTRNSNEKQTTSEHSPTAITKALQREAAKQKAMQFKKERKERQKEEKERKRWLGGVAWGFDPTAGILPSSQTDEAEGGCYVSAGRSIKGLQGVDEIDEVGRRTGRRWVGHNLWGVERGGPGQEGKYGHGSLRDRLAGPAVPIVRKPRSPSPWRQDSGVRGPLSIAPSGAAECPWISPG